MALPLVWYLRTHSNARFTFPGAVCAPCCNIHRRLRTDSSIVPPFASFARCSRSRSLKFVATLVDVCTRTHWARSPYVKRVAYIMVALYLCVNKPKREWLLQRRTRVRLFTFIFIVQRRPEKQVAASDVAFSIYFCSRCSKSTAENSFYGCPLCASTSCVQ